MLIYIGADHRGFQLKESLKSFLKERGYEVVDVGNKNYDENDDYPDFVLPVAGKVAEDPENSRGVVLGASGQGEAMAVNRLKGVRAAVYYGGEEEILILSREHNNANILSLGAEFLDEETAKRAVLTWLQTSFSGDERHRRRLKKIDS